MKSVKWVWGGLFVLLAMAHGVSARPRQPLPPLPPTGPVLYSESFDEPYTAGNTNTQVVLDGYTYDQSWSGYALQRSGTITPFLVPGIDATGRTNFGVSGTFRNWFIPLWSSASLTGGTGPGVDVPLLEWTAVANGQATVIFSLEASADGSLLALLEPGDGGPVALLTNTISWQAGQPHLLTLNYGPGGTALFVDGQLAAQGSGTPSVSLATAELSVGSTVSGGLAAGGDFDELYSLGRAQTTNDVSFYYAATSGQAALGPVSDAEYAAWLAQAQSAASAPLAGGFAMSFGLLGGTGSGDCVTGGQPYFTNFMATTQSNQQMTFSFTIAGGSNGMPYDLYSTENLTNLLQYSQWTCLGRVYNCNSYVLSNQLPSMQFYALGPPPDMQVVPWGDDSFGESDVPPGLTNVVAVAAGFYFSAALKDDGTVVEWGDNTYGETNVPSGLTNVTSITAGELFSAALLSNGTVTAWGLDADTLTPPWHLTDVPSNLTNVTAISAGPLHTLALRSDGTIVSWGYDDSGVTNVPAGLSNVVAVAAGFDFSLAATTDGTVAGWGDNTYGQTNVPAGLSNVVNVAAGPHHALALLNNGTVVAWGDNSYGATNVPAGLTNVVAIAAGGYPEAPYESAFSLALKSDGTIVAWGDGTVFPTVGGLTGVTAIAGGAYHTLALRPGPFTPLIYEEPAGEVLLMGSNTTFSVTADSANDTYQWQLNGTNLSGATNATLSLTNVQASNTGIYTVIISNSAGAITSSNAVLTLLGAPQILSTTPPAPGNDWFSIATNLSVSATDSNVTEFPLYYQWQYDGTNIAGATNDSLSIIPTISTAEGNYSVIVTNLAGATNVGPWNVHVLLPGMVAAWGDDSAGQCDRPESLTNVMAIAGGYAYSVVAKDDGTVVQWGYDWAAVPTNLSNVVSVAAGYMHTLALKNDGTVVSWGATNDPANTVPTNLTGVTAIAAGWDHNVVLLTNGTVTAWGSNNALLGIYVTNVPTGLSNVVAISANAYHSLALKSDGTVAAWGYGTDGETNVPAGLSNVVAIAAGELHNLALKSNGTVVAWGFDEFGETNVPAGLSNVIAVAAGNEYSLALKNDGTVVAWGNNSFGQTNTPSLTNVKLIAAGGSHALAATFSPLVQYTVNVTNDLLLIYNTNSTDSATVMNYYLAHRPMVSNANVLGISVTNAFNYDTVSPADYTNLVWTPITNWLAANPTKRPQYVILFLDVPARVLSCASNTNNYPFNCSESPSPYSVSYQIATTVSSWQPFVTHINMNGTNDCIAYIDKLALFGSNYSSGKLIISARTGGYENTNYYFDDTETGYGGDGLGLGAMQALIQAGISSNAITYTNVIPDCGSLACHITNGSNCAGYLSWGGHSYLGAGYATNGYVNWTGSSGWWIIQTIESFNGQRASTDQGSFTQWFSSNAFGGTNYSNTPIGAISNVAEDFAGFNAGPYFGLWGSGKNFAICAWNARYTPYPQVVGDPFVTH